MTTSGLSMEGAFASAISGWTNGCQRAQMTEAIRVLLWTLLEEIVEHEEYGCNHSEGGGMCFDSFEARIGELI